MRSTEWFVVQNLKSYFRNSPIITIMKLQVNHQERYSRGELLLRSFFGVF